VIQLINFVDLLFSIYRYMMIGYILLSWFPNGRDSFIGIWLGRLVEPFLRPFRRLIPPLGGMIDISPIVAFFALMFLQLGVSRVLMMFL
jgi:YggT family protein